MTDKQRDYILSLDEKLYRKGLSVSSEDILGYDWEKNYKQIPVEEASECIDQLKGELRQ